MIGDKSNKFASGLLKLVFQNTPLPNIGDLVGLRASNTTGSLYISLMSTTSSEISYLGYSRQEVPRGVSDWSVNDTIQQVVNNNQINFPLVEGGLATAYYAGIYTDSVIGDPVYLIPMVAPLPIARGNTPIIEAGDLIINEV